MRKKTQICVFYVKNVKYSQMKICYRNNSIMYFYFLADFCHLLRILFESTVQKPLDPLERIDYR